MAYQKGDWAEAERLSRAVLAHDADFPPALSLLGIIAAQTNRAAAAAEWFARAVAADPGDAAAHSNLGNALQALGRFDEALASYDRAIALKPDAVAVYLNHGATLHELNRFAEALTSYERALVIDPGSARACNNRGNALYRLGRLSEALSSYELSLKLDPGLADAHYNRGNVLRDLARLDEAQQSYRRAIALQPGLQDAVLNCGASLQQLGRAEEALAVLDQAIARNPRFAQAISNRGNVLQELGRLEESLASHEQAIGQDPNYAEAHYNRGNTLKLMKRPDQALASYDVALQLKPDYAEAWLNRGVAAQALGRTDDALADYAQALRLKPGYAEASLNRGIALQHQMRLGEALASYTEAIETRPDYIEAHNNRSLLRLAQGNFAQGWEEFEWRWQTAEMRAQRPVAVAPTWQGEPLDGSLLVRNEQGVGDEIFYAGMFRDLQARASSITACVDPRLIPLLRRSFDGIAWVSKQTLNVDLAFDAEISMGSLGRYLRSDAEWFEGRGATAYLRACATRASTLRAQLHNGDKLICGLSWVSKNRDFGADKSMRLPDLEALFRLPGFDFVDLQYGDTGKERAELNEVHGLSLRKIEQIDNFNDLDGLAALIEACDLVVTVSNTTAHLAAALGKPLLLMLPFSPGLLWYWHANRDDSPWYASARLFRQERAGDWNSVIRRVGKYLEAYSQA